jgi:phage terminase large subunit-like protein
MQAIFISIFILLSGSQQFEIKQYKMTMTECLQSLTLIDETIENSRNTMINGVTAIYVGSACVPIFESGEL